MPTATQTRPLFEQIDTWLQGLQETKTAAAPKKGRVKSALKGVGKTTHPSESADDNTQSAPEGARSKENISDVEKDVQGDAITGDSPIKADEDDVMPNIGVDQSATGEDASIETSSVKGDKDDPGTTHPADADKIGEKYASMSLPALIKVAEAKANDILAHIANGHFASPAQPQPQARPTQGKQAQAKQPAAKPTQTTQVDAGYKAAADAAQYEKAAAEFVETTMRDADLDADLVGSYLTAYYQKRAMDDEGGQGEDHLPPPGDPAAGGAPPMAGGAPPMGGGDMPPPGGDPMGGGGMPPPGGGGDPMAALGAAANDAPAAPGGDDKAKALADLGNVLAELGFTPEDLTQLAQQGPAPEEGAKLASAVKAYKRSGKFRISEPKTAQEKRSRDMIRDYVMEITGLKS